jgi:hypothetical protein
VCQKPRSKHDSAKANQKRIVAMQNDNPITTPAKNPNVIPMIIR